MKMSHPQELSKLIRRCTFGGNIYNLLSLRCSACEIGFGVTFGKKIGKFDTCLYFTQVVIECNVQDLKYLFVYFKVNELK